MVIYLVKFRPFKSELQQVVVVSDEFVVIGGVALLYVLYHYQYDSLAAYQISVTIIGVILVSFAKNICIIILLTLRKNYIKLRTWIHTKYNYPELRRQRLAKELEILREEERIENGELLEKKRQDQIIIIESFVNDNDSTPECVSSLTKYMRS